jgi:cell division protein FtsI (penicillin-binding protein 3)
MAFAIVAVFSIRLIDIQIVRADALNKDSLTRRATSLTTYAPRGQILDTNGVVLADSVTRYDITVSPRIIKPTFEIATSKGKTKTVTVQEAAAEIANITKQDPAVIMQAITKDPTSDFAVVTKAIDTAAMRKVRALHIPWIIFQNHPVRTYPDGSVAGNLIGFVGTDGPQNGIETIEDKCLASTNGSSTYERGADGVQIPGSTITTKEARPGGAVTLTIDHDLEWFADQAIAEQAQAIGAQSATAVVLRVKDAALMALADWPSVDPNNVNATAVEHPDQLGSKAFTDYYEPGSTMKALTAATLIDTGKATPTDPVTVPSAWTSPEGHTIHDATGHPVEHLTLTGVLQQSSNVGISQFGVRVPQKTRFDYLTKFGLGQKTAVDFQGEQSRGITALPWNDVSKYDISYGQGIAVSAVQLASAYQALANGGVKLPLKLVQSCTAADGTVSDIPSNAGTRVVSEQTSKTVVNMLESVVTGGELSKTLTIPGYRVAAKSGTAEVAVPGRGYTSDRIVSVVGIAPAEDPQYIVLVTYTKPAIMKSSAAAAPTFHKIMSEVLTKYRVTPSTTPSTNPPTNW